MPCFGIRAPRRRVPRPRSESCKQSRTFTPLLDVRQIAALQAAPIHAPLAQIVRQGVVRHGGPAPGPIIP